MRFQANFTPETIAEGEAWVNENVPGVKAVTTGYESIDVFLITWIRVAIVR